jgi:hypothetical protein
MSIAGFTLLTDGIATNVASCCLNLWSGADIVAVWIIGAGAAFYTFGSGLNTTGAYPFRRSRVLAV